MPETETLPSRQPTGTPRRGRRTPALALLVLLSTVLFAEDLMAIEEPSYTVVERYDGFEVRRYAPYVVAELQAGPDFDRAGSNAFRPLARFIGGANEGGREIAMTAPVEQQQQGQRIAMTAPVLQADGADGGYVVRFVLPAGMTLETAPQPTDPRITLRQVPERTLAVRPYRGGWAESRYREEERALLDAVEARGLATAGAPIFARYNSPFRIWFLRRNEVMLELAPAGG